MSWPEAPFWIASRKAFTPPDVSVLGGLAGYQWVTVNWWFSLGGGGPMPGSVIVSGARPPIGKMSGAFADLAAVDLGGFAIKAALERAGVSPEQVDYVYMGQVILAGTGQITARQGAAQTGRAETVARA